MKSPCPVQWRFCRIAVLAVHAVLLSWLGNAAHAANVTWNVAGSGNWDTTTTNWTGGSTKFTNGDNATFNNAAGGTITITPSDVAPGSTTVTATTNPYIFTGADITSGTLTKSGSGALTVQNKFIPTTAATVTVSAGTLTLASTSKLNLRGGLTVSGASTVVNLDGEVYKSAADGGRPFQISTGTINYSYSSSTLTVGNNGSIIGLGGTSSFNITAGSLTTASSTNASGGWQIGYGVDGVGELNINNGKLSQGGNNWFWLGYETVGSPTTNSGTVNLSGTMGGTGELELPKGTTGVLSGPQDLVLGFGNDANGIINLNSGGLLSNGRDIVRLGGTAIVNFNGGTLKALASSTTYMTGLTAANVKSSGAKIHTNTYDITIGQALVHDGASPDGGLTKQGTGILTLSAASTYDGNTSITGGTLKLASTGSINSTPLITVGTGATYDVSAVSGGYTLLATQTLAGVGTVKGNVTLAAGANLSPGNSPGTLTFDNNLNISATGGSNSGDLIFDLGSSSDLVVLSTGTLSIGSALGFNDFAFTPGLGFTPGIYTLFQTGSTIIGTLDGTNLSGTVGGYAASLSFDVTNTDLILTVIPEPGSFVMMAFGMLSMWLFCGGTRLPRKAKVGNG